MKIENELETNKNITIQTYKEYELGLNVDIEFFINEKSVSILDIIELTLATQGVDDKIYLTITSNETDEIIFYGRNMYLRTAPIGLLSSKIIAIDDCGKNGSMNFIISTKDWKRRKI